MCVVLYFTYSVPSNFQGKIFVQSVQDISQDIGWHKNLLGAPAQIETNSPSVQPNSCLQSPPTFIECL